ncbi:hypothetical protein PLESTB_001713300 [Pleodorina starrii]|uniref:Ankyrin repeat protein n=1 Tax=Pleodorina starrii TaxID=330485 RepID=A0A9W6C080_9CHLO|nr:hypothetical protein PLESTB_001713300 [Pleodorina starrii]GLC75871.1 hypothetical protein PLESTF_001698800 [Pleodorina starrii]
MIRLCPRWTLLTRHHPGIIENIARFVPQNDVAASLRLVNKTSADLLRDCVHIKLSQLVRQDVFYEHWSVLGVMRAYTLQQRKQFVCLVVASGSICNLEVAITVAELSPGEDVFTAAAAAGHLDVCKWLVERGFPKELFTAFIGASRGGHVEICGWLLGQSEERSKLDLLERGCTAAAHSGHVALIEWMLQRCHPLMKARDRARVLPSEWNPGWLLEAVAHGCTLPVLQRLYSEWVEPLQGGQGLGDRRDAILAAAAGSPTPDWRAKVEWLEQRGFTCTVGATYLAADLPDPDALERLQWLRQRGYPIDRQAAIRAACTGNPTALDYVLSVGVSWLSTEQVEDVAQVDDVAYGGNLAVLQTLHARGWISSQAARRAVFRAALEVGHVHVAAWCVEALGCSVVPLLGRIHAKASLEVLTWLADQQGIRKWHSKWLTRAADSGCVAAVEWLVDRGCRMPNDGSPYYKAACNGDLAMLRCLRRLGCPWGGEDAALEPRRHSSLDPTVLQWLRQEGCDAYWFEVLESGSTSCWSLPL